MSEQTNGEEAPESGVPSRRVWRCPPPKVIDPHEDHELIQQHPLCVWLPEPEDGLREFVAATSILTGEDQRGKLAVRAVARARVEARKAYRAQYAKWQHERVIPFWNVSLFRFASLLGLVSIATSLVRFSWSAQTLVVGLMVVSFLGCFVGIRRLITEHERRRFEDGTALEEELTEAGWRGFHRYMADMFRLTDATYERDKRLWAESLQAARESLEHLVKEYFPVTLRPQMMMAHEVASESDPVKLLRFCLKSGKDKVSEAIRFQARILLALTQMEFEIRLDRSAPAKLDEVMAGFSAKIDREYCAPGESEQVVVIAELDPSNSYRVKSFEVIPRTSKKARVKATRTRVVMPLTLRVIYVNGRKILVGIEIRRKERIPLKLLCKRVRHHEIVTDKIGAKCIYLEREHDLVDGVQRMREKIAYIPGSVSGQASNAKRAGAVDQSNQHSSAEYEATKYDLRFWNELIELQFMWLPHYIDELVSSGSLNHPLYKLRKFLDLLFPVIFPTELYGLDWRDPEVRERLWDYMVSKI